MKIYSFTTTGGELYEVHKLGGYYQLYKNGNHTQCMLPDSMHHEEAISKLIQMEKDEVEAEIVFFKNHPELNP